MADAVVPYVGWGSLSQAWNTQAWNTVILLNKTVTVVSDGGNKYAIDGTTQASLVLARGQTYVFDVSDSSVGTHPLQFSTTSDGTHGGGSAYTSGVSTSGSAGSSGATVTFAVPLDAPDQLYYYCIIHRGMGGGVTVYNISIIPAARTATTAVVSSGGTAVTITGLAGTSGLGSVTIAGADTSITITTTDIIGTTAVGSVTVIGDANTFTYWSGNTPAPGVNFNHVFAGLSANTNYSYRAMISSSNDLCDRYIYGDT